MHFQYCLKNTLLLLRFVKIYVHSCINVFSPSSHGSILPIVYEIIIQMLQNMQCLKAMNQWRSQFCTWHNSSAVVPCEHLQPDWIITIKVKAFFSKRFHSCADKLFVKWAFDCRIPYCGFWFGLSWMWWQYTWNGKSFWQCFWACFNRKDCKCVLLLITGIP